MPFSDYIALCEEIIEFRKKRLYTDAKMIAKRGDLDESYRHLIDAIEQVGTVATPSPLNGVSVEPLETAKADLSELKDLVRSLEREIDTLGAMNANNDRTNVTPEPFRSSNFSSADTNTWGSRANGWLLTLSEALENLIAGARGLLKGNSLNSSQTIILFVAILATAMLVLFLVGATRRPLPLGSHSPAKAEITPMTVNSAMQGALNSDKTFPPRVTPTANSLPENFEPTKIDLTLDLLDNEILLSKLVETLSVGDDTPQSDLQWLATQLDILRALCIGSKESKTAAALLRHMQLGFERGTPSRTAAMKLVFDQVRTILQDDPTGKSLLAA